MESHFLEHDNQLSQLRESNKKLTSDVSFWKSKQEIQEKRFNHQLELLKKQMTANTNNIHHHIRKRKALSLDKADTCFDINHICTFYFPDYPDSPTFKVPMIHRKEGTNTATTVSDKSKSSAIDRDNGFHAEESATKLQSNKKDDNDSYNNKGGMVPSSCKDLNEIGHTLNGFYSVKSKIVKNKIDTIFCNFNNDQSAPENENSNIN